MGIIPYQRVAATGEMKIFYMVVAEATNRFTGLRIQKKRRGIPSKPKALHVYKELWSMCREERPDGASLKNWGELVERYFIYLDGLFFIGAYQF